jgi:hypothetical protein
MDPSAIVVAATAGDPQTTIMTGAITSPFSQSLALLPSCTATVNGQFAIARPGIRLASFLGALGSHGLFHTVCSADYTTAFADFANAIALATGPCIAGNLATTDIDPTNPGLQLACTATVGTTTIPACKMSDATTPDPSGPQPCYWLESAAAACASTQSHVAVRTSGTLPAGALALACVGS